MEKNRMQLSRILFALAMLFSGCVYANISTIGNGRSAVLNKRCNAVRLPMSRWGAPSFDPKSEVCLYLQLGILDLKSQRYANAVADFDEVLVFTQSIPALVDRGIAYTALGNPEAALASYTTAISLDPKEVAALRNRAAIYAQHGQDELAVRDYSSVLVLNPDSALTYIGRAASRFDLKQYSLAASDYWEAAVLRGGDVELYRMAGLSYDIAGRYGDAIACFTSALRLAGDTLAYTQRARAYSHAGDDRSSLADLSTAISLAPNDADARWMRAVYFERIQQLSLAIDDYTAILSKAPRSVEALVFRADDLTDIGQDDEAMRDYERASQIAPDDVGLRFGRMHFWFYLGDYSKSIADATRWIELDHQDKGSRGAQLPYVLAWRLMSLQRLGDGDQDKFEAQASQLNHDSWPYPVIEYYLGQVSRAQVENAAHSGDQSGLPGRLCELDAYLGEASLARHEDAAASGEFKAAIAVCPQTFIERVLAKRELSRPLRKN